MNKISPMYRSASWNRVSEDYAVHASPKSASVLRIGSVSAAALEDGDQPPYDPAFELAKKEKSSSKFAKNAVHVIPFVLLACALILWFFSNPDVDVGLKGESIAGRIEGLTIEGDIDNDSDGTQTGFLATADVGDSDSKTTKQRLLKRQGDSRSRRTSRKLVEVFQPY